jgi:hypothetical protein
MEASMNETWVIIFGTNALEITAGQLGVRAGLGRHQLVVPIEVRPMDEAAYGHSFSFLGSVSASGLSGGGGYLGSFHETAPQRLSANGKLRQELCADIEPRQIEEIERRREGNFSLELNIEVKAEEGANRATALIQDHAVPREAWIAILEQIKYQRTILLEIRSPDLQAAPHLAKAVGFFNDAQRRLLEGDPRAVVEALRQSLAALVDQDPDDESSAESLNAALKAARVEKGPYFDRYELVRSNLKFLTDLAAHPDSGRTGPVEARSTVTMVAGLLQWYAQIAPSTP